MLFFFYYIPYFSYVFIHFLFLIIWTFCYPGKIRTFTLIWVSDSKSDVSKPIPPQDNLIVVLSRFELEIFCVKNKRVNHFHHRTLYFVVLSGFEPEIFWVKIKRVSQFHHRTIKNPNKLGKKKPNQIWLGKKRYNSSNQINLICCCWIIILLDKFLIVIIYIYLFLPFFSNSVQI